MAPIQGAPLGRRTAIGVHPVHAVLSHQTYETLGKFLHRLIECLTGAVPMLSQYVILRLHNAGEAPHENAPFSHKITVNLFLKCAGKEVA